MTHPARGRVAAAVFAIAAVAFALAAAACGAAIGRSVEGREIAVYKIGEGPRDVVLIGGLHTGPEDNGRVILEQLATYMNAHAEYIPASVTLHIIPSGNPDGTALGLHTNARGVDLNRNWPADNWAADACHPYSGCIAGLGGPAPLSEPEAQALYSYIENVRPVITAVWHAEAPLVEANEVAGADVLARAFADGAGYPYVEEWTAYPITGQLIDALEQRLGLRAFDIELMRCCEVTPEELYQNILGVVALLNAVDRSRDLDGTPTPSARPRPQRTPTIQIRIPSL